MWVISMGASGYLMLFLSTGTLTVSLFGLSGLDTDFNCTPQWQNRSSLQFPSSSLPNLSRVLLGLCS